MQEVKMSGESLNIEQENISKLKEIFPEVFNEDKIDFDKLQNVLGNYIDTDEEKYRFTWNGKMNALRLSQTPSIGTLRPCKEESRDWDTTQNLYIEGDNLEVLKLLQNSYLNKIKMIYIDPPYNTGGDFVYKDDFTDNIDNYKKVTGQVDSEGNATSTNKDSDGRYHTNWLNMIYPRLRLARNLLAENGIIFISIDDNEVTNLKKMCDEIFGESNFIANFPRVTKRGGKSTDTYAKNHDYVLVYAKNIVFSDIKGITHIDEGFKYKDEFFEKRGAYKLNQTLDYNTLGYINSLDYPIEIDGKTYYPGNVTEQEFLERKSTNPKDGFRWRWSKSLFDFGYKNGWIVVGNSGRIYTKTYLNASIEKNSTGSYFIDYKERTKPLTTLDFVENNYSNDNSNKEITNIIGKSLFDYVKPTSLIKQFMSTCTNKDSIILDFFSGSSTTAHAVMQYNLEDNSNRKFIMVQLPELTDEKSEAYISGYKTICDIAKKRIKCVGDVIKTNVENNNNNILDIGFKVFKLDSSNMRKWNPDTKNIEQSLLDQINNFVDGRTEEDALYEIILKNGLPLTVPVEELDIKGKKVYSVGCGALIVCLDNDITLDVADDIAKISTEFEDKSQVTVVFKDNGFANDSVKTNIKETLKGYGIGKFVTV